MDQRLKNERINLILKLLMAILFTTGAIIFSYPFLANAVNSYYDPVSYTHLTLPTNSLV